MSKRLEQIMLKNIQMANKNIKKCSKLLDIWDMPTKIRKTPNIPQWQKFITHTIPCSGADVE